MSATRASGKVSGHTIECTLDEVMSVFRRRIEDSLADRGIDSIEGDDWYSVETFAEVLHTVEADAGASTVNKLGVAIVESMEWTRQPTTPTDALGSLSDGFTACHRGRTRDFDCEREGDDFAKITAETPYPCAFDKGVIKGVAEEFGAEFVTLDHATTECRDDGDSACVYEVSW